jgi:hypothetical protein
MGALHEDLSMYHTAGNNTRNTLLCIYDNTFNTYYIVRETCTPTMQREGIAAFPWQQWSRERVTMLQYTYEGVSKIFRTGAAVYTEVARSTGRW